MTAIDTWPESCRCDCLCTNLTDLRGDTRCADCMIGDHRTSHEPAAPYDPYAYTDPDWIGDDW